MKPQLILPLVALTAALAGACSPAAAPVAAVEAPSAAPSTVVADVAPVTGEADAAQSPPSPQTPEAAPLLPRVTVHKSPSCGCCSAWVDHIRQAGYPVDVMDGEEDLTPLKLALGVPAGQGSCHTAIVEGYFIEGHVPAEDVVRLLAERPDARGLTVPGMPVGSPGMEVPSGEVQPYTVFLVNHDGSTTPFSEHGGQAARLSQ